MEVFHRADGKWITCVEKKEQKLALLKFGMTVFDNRVDSVSNLINLL